MTPLNTELIKTGLTVFSHACTAAVVCKQVAEQFIASHDCIPPSSSFQLCLCEPRDQDDINQDEIDALNAANKENEIPRATVLVVVNISHVVSLCSHLFE